MALLKFKIIKFSNHRAHTNHSLVVGNTECSEAFAEFSIKTGRHRISGFDRSGRRWSIEIDNDLIEQMRTNDAAWGAPVREGDQ